MYGQTVVVWTLQSDVMYLNTKKIDNTSKTLLDLQARSFGDQIELQEAKTDPETHVSYAQWRKIYPHLNF